MDQRFERCLPGPGPRRPADEPVKRERVAHRFAELVVAAQLDAARRDLQPPLLDPEAGETLAKVVSGEPVTESEWDAAREAVRQLTLACAAILSPAAAEE